MKKINFLLILIVLFIFSGCSLNSMIPDKITTDAVKIYYGDVNDSVIIEDEELTKTVTAIYNKLELKTTDKKMDNASTINVVFYENKKEKAVLSVDKNGILYLYRDNKKLYKAVNKEFSYELLEKVYNENK